MADGTIAYFALLAREYRPGTDRNCQDMPCIIEAYCPPSECNVELYLQQITTWTRQYQLGILAP